MRAKAQLFRFYSFVSGFFKECTINIGWKSVVSVDVFFCLYFFCQLEVSIIIELEITVQADKALDWNDLWICGQATKK